ncbi:MAG: NAD(P)H-dependent oxidoreductase [Sphingomonadales bacterium]|nr:NAD(P)H-dependent oxidoreductase [Sphingomonadales bacterium]
MAAPVRIVGLGGTLRAGSGTERLVAQVLDRAAALGAQVEQITGPMLALPLYAYGDPPGEAAEHMIEALRRADGIVLASPGYHGSISGLVKNALDHVEAMSRDPAPYFDGRAVLCLATGGGSQGANAALTTLRSITHALRGWPTPLGLAVNTAGPLFDEAGALVDPALAAQLDLAAAQLVGFARQTRASAGDAMTCDF